MFFYSVVTCGFPPTWPCIHIRLQSAFDSGVCPEPAIHFLPFFHPRRLTFVLCTCACACLECWVSGMNRPLRRPTTAFPLIFLQPHLASCSLVCFVLVQFFFSEETTKLPKGAWQEQTYEQLNRLCRFTQRRAPSMKCLPIG